MAKETEGQSGYARVHPASVKSGSVSRGNWPPPLGVKKPGRRSQTEAGLGSSVSAEQLRFLEASVEPGTQEPGPERAKLEGVTHPKSTQRSNAGPEF